MLLTQEEVNRLHRVEKVLDLPKNKLVRALVRDRALMLLDTSFPMEKTNIQKQTKKTKKGETKC